MRKIVLLNVGLAALLITATTTIFAQRETATGVEVDKKSDLLRRDLRAERKKLVASNLQLTEDEAAKGSVAVGRHCDQVSVLLPRQLDYFCGRVAVQHDAPHIQPRQRLGQHARHLRDGGGSMP